MKKKEKRKLRKKIAKRVSLKMMYMGVCPNERDIILNVILPKKDKYSWKLHCEDECAHTRCEVKKWFLNNKEEKRHDN